MIEVNSLFVVLMLEAVVGLCVLLMVFLLFFRNKRSIGQQAAHELIDKLDEEAYNKVSDLDDMISENCSIPPQVQSEILTEINYKERVLYQKIIQMFLNRDEELLKEMEQHINDLTEPYCKIIRLSSEKTEETEKMQVAEAEIQKLTQESEQFEEELTVAINTMNEISAEYTRVFSGSQTEMMLENSSKKMFEIFHEAEQKIKGSFEK